MVLITALLVPLPVPLPHLTSLRLQDCGLNMQQLHSLMNVAATTPALADARCSQRLQYTDLPGACPSHSASSCSTDAIVTPSLPMRCSSFILKHLKLIRSFNSVLSNELRRGPRTAVHSHTDAKLLRLRRFTSHPPILQRQTSCRRTAQEPIQA